jgi:hypothetical protein
MAPIQGITATRLRGNLNVIKLHGSFNWRTAGAQSTMVVGTGKTSQISASPLLAWYFDIFGKVLSAGGVRLMIVGYGFGDAHVNAVIADAIEHHDLKVFIWDAGSNLKQRILEAPHGASIWKGLLSTASRPMIEVFPSNQAETQEYRRILETFLVRAETSAGIQQEKRKFRLLGPLPSGVVLPAAAVLGTSGACRSSDWWA